MFLVYMDDTARLVDAVRDPGDAWGFLNDGWCEVDSAAEAVEFMKLAFEEGYTRGHLVEPRERF